jgi:hypothetical protein
MTQFDESLEGEFPSRSAERSRGYYPPSDVRAVQQLKEAVQFLLEGTANQVHKEKDHGGKGQLTVSGEMLFRQSMSMKKIGGLEIFSQEINNIGTYFGKQIPCQKRHLSRALQETCWASF